MSSTPTMLAMTRYLVSAAFTGSTLPQCLLGLVAGGGLLAGVRTTRRVDVRSGLRLLDLVAAPAPPDEHGERREHPPLERVEKVPQGRERLWFRQRGRRDRPQVLARAGHLATGGGDLLGD